MNCSPFKDSILVANTKTGNIETFSKKDLIKTLKDLYVAHKNKDQKLIDVVREEIQTRYKRLGILKPNDPLLPFINEIVNPAFSQRETIKKIPFILNLMVVLSPNSSKYFFVSDVASIEKEVNRYIEENKDFLSETFDIEPKYWEENKDQIKTIANLTSAFYKETAEAGQKGNTFLCYKSVQDMENFSETLTNATKDLKKYPEIENTIKSMAKFYVAQIIENRYEKEKDRKSMLEKLFTLNNLSEIKKELDKQIKEIKDKGTDKADNSNNVTEVIITGKNTVKASIQRDVQTTLSDYEVSKIAEQIADKVVVPLVEENIKLKESVASLNDTVKELKKELATQKIEIQKLTSAIEKLTAVLSAGAFITNNNQAHTFFEQVQKAIDDTVAGLDEAGKLVAQEALKKKIEEAKNKANAVKNTVIKAKNEIALTVIPQEEKEASGLVEKDGTVTYQKQTYHRVSHIIEQSMLFNHKSHFYRVKELLSETKILNNDTADRYVLMTLAEANLKLTKPKLRVLSFSLAMLMVDSDFAREIEGAFNKALSEGKTFSIEDVPSLDEIIEKDMKDNFNNVTEDLVKETQQNVRTFLTRAFLPYKYYTARSAMGRISEQYVQELIELKRKDPKATTPTIIQFIKEKYPNVSVQDFLASLTTIENYSYVESQRDKLATLIGEETDIEKVITQINTFLNDPNPVNEKAKLFEENENYQDDPNFANKIIGEWQKQTAKANVEIADGLRALNKGGDELAKKVTKTLKKLEKNKDVENVQIQYNPVLIRKIYDESGRLYNVSGKPDILISYEEDGETKYMVYEIKSIPNKSAERKIITKEPVAHTLKSKYTTQVRFYNALLSGTLTNTEDSPVVSANVCVLGGIDTKSKEDKKPLLPLATVPVPYDSATAFNNAIFRRGIESLKELHGISEDEQDFVDKTDDRKGIAFFFTQPQTWAEVLYSGQEDIMLRLTVGQTLVQQDIGTTGNPVSIEGYPIYYTDDNGNQNVIGIVQNDGKLDEEVFQQLAYLTEAYKNNDLASDIVSAYGMNVKPLRLMFNNDVMKQKGSGKTGKTQQAEEKTMNMDTLVEQIKEQLKTVVGGDVEFEFNEHKNQIEFKHEEKVVFRQTVYKPEIKSETFDQVLKDIELLIQTYEKDNAIFAKMKDPKRDATVEEFRKALNNVKEFVLGNYSAIRKINIAGQVFFPFDIVFQDGEPILKFLTKEAPIMSATVELPRVMMASAKDAKKALIMLQSELREYKNWVTKTKTKDNVVTEPTSEPVRITEFVQENDKVVIMPSKSFITPPKKKNEITQGYYEQRKERFAKDAYFFLLNNSLTDAEGKTKEIWRNRLNMVRIDDGTAIPYATELFVEMYTVLAKLATPEQLPEEARAFFSNLSVSAETIEKTIKNVSEATFRNNLQQLAKALENVLYQYKFGMKTELGGTAGFEAGISRTVSPKQLYKNMIDFISNMATYRSEASTEEEMLSEAVLRYAIYRLSFEGEKAETEKEAKAEQSGTEVTVGFSEADETTVPDGDEDGQSHEEDAEGLPASGISITEGASRVSMEKNVNKILKNLFQSIIIKEEYQLGVDGKKQVVSVPHYFSKRFLSSNYFYQLVHLVNTRFVLGKDKKIVQIPCNATDIETMKKNVLSYLTTMKNTSNEFYFSTLAFYDMFFNEANPLSLVNSAKTDREYEHLLSAIFNAQASFAKQRFVVLTEEGKYKIRNISSDVDAIMLSLSKFSKENRKGSLNAGSMDIMGKEAVLHWISTEIMGQTNASSNFANTIYNIALSIYEEAQKTKQQGGSRETYVRNIDVTKQAITDAYKRHVRKEEIQADTDDFASVMAVLLSDDVSVQNSLREKLTLNKAQMGSNVFRNLNGDIRSDTMLMSETIQQLNKAVAWAKYQANSLRLRNQNLDDIKEIREMRLATNLPYYKHNAISKGELTSFRYFLGIEADTNIEFGKMDEEAIFFRYYYAGVYVPLFKQKASGQRNYGIEISIPHFKSSNKDVSFDAVFDTRGNTRNAAQKDIKTFNKWLVEEVKNRMLQEVYAKEKINKKKFTEQELNNLKIEFGAFINEKEKDRTKKIARLKPTIVVNNANEYEVQLSDEEIIKHFEERTSTTKEKIDISLGEYKDQMSEMLRDEEGFYKTVAIATIYKWDLDTYLFGYIDEYKGDVSKANKRASISTSVYSKVNTDTARGVGKKMTIAYIDPPKKNMPLLVSLGYADDTKDTEYDQYDGGAFVNPLFSYLSLSSTGKGYGYQLTDEGSHKPVGAFRDENNLKTITLKLASFDLLLKEIDKPHFFEMKKMLVSMFGKGVLLDSYFYDEDGATVVQGLVRALAKTNNVAETDIPFNDETIKRIPLKHLDIEKMAMWYQANNYLSEQLAKGKPAEEIENPYAFDDPRYVMLEKSKKNQTYDKRIDRIIMMVADAQALKTVKPQKSLSFYANQNPSEIRDIADIEKDFEEKTMLMSYPTDKWGYQLNPHHDVEHKKETPLATQLLYLVSTFNKNFGNEKNKEVATKIYETLFDIISKVPDVVTLLPYAKRDEEGKIRINIKEFVRTVYGETGMPEAVRHILEMAEKANEEGDFNVDPFASPELAKKLILHATSTLEKNIVRMKSQGSDYVLVPDFFVKKKVVQEDGTVEYKELEWSEPYLEYKGKEYKYSDLLNTVIAQKASKKKGKAFDFNEVQKQAALQIREWINDKTVKITKLGKTELAVSVPDKGVLNAYTTWIKDYNKMVKILQEAGVKKVKPIDTFRTYEDNPHAHFEKAMAEKKPFAELQALAQQITDKKSKEEYEKRLEKYAEKYETAEKDVLENFRNMVNPFGVRIPTTGKNNTVVGKVVKFLETSSNVVVAPTEIVKIHRSDYDIKDRLKIFFKTFNAKAVSTNKMLLEQIDTIMDKFEELLLDPSNVYEAFTDIDFSDAKRNLAVLSKLRKKELVAKEIPYGTAESDARLQTENMVNTYLVRIFATLTKQMVYTIHTGTNINGIALSNDLPDEEKYIYKIDENGNIVKQPLSQQDVAKMAKSALPFNAISIATNAAIDAVKEQIHGSANVNLLNATLFATLLFQRNMFFTMAFYATPFVHLKTKYIKNDALDLFKNFFLSDTGNLETEAYVLKTRESEGKFAISDEDLTKVIGDSPQYEEFESFVSTVKKYFKDDHKKFLTKFRDTILKGNSVEELIKEFVETNEEAKKDTNFINAINEYKEAFSKPIVLKNDPNQKEYKLIQAIGFLGKAYNKGLEDTKPISKNSSIMGINQGYQSEYEKNVIKINTAQTLDTGTAQTLFAKDGAGYMYLYYVKLQELFNALAERTVFTSALYKSLLLQYGRHKKQEDRDNFTKRFQNAFFAKMLSSLLNGKIELGGKKYDLSKSEHVTDFVNYVEGSLFKGMGQNIFNALSSGINIRNEKIFFNKKTYENNAQSVALAKEFLTKSHRFLLALRNAKINATEITPEMLKEEFINSLQGYEYSELKKQGIITEPQKDADGNANGTVKLNEQKLQEQVDHIHSFLLATYLYFAFNGKNASMVASFPSAPHYMFSNMTQITQEFLSAVTAIYERNETEKINDIETILGRQLYRGLPLPKINVFELEELYNEEEVTLPVVIDKKENYAVEVFATDKRQSYFIEKKTDYQDGTSETNTYIKLTGKEKNAFIEKYVSDPDKKHQLSAYRFLYLNVATDPLINSSEDNIVPVIFKGGQKLFGHAKKNKQGNIYAYHKAFLYSGKLQEKKARDSNDLVDTGQTKVLDTAKGILKGIAFSNSLLSVDNNLKNSIENLSGNLFGIMLYQVC
jgi:hypothetical protein